MSDVPGHIARVADIMSSFRGDWFLCGGWAVDAWLGRETRKHGDIDVSIFEEDQRALFDHLDGWTMIAHDPNVDPGTDERWNGRRLDLPAHIHAPSQGFVENGIVRSHDGFNLEILLNEQSDDSWILSGEPRVKMPLSRCAQESVWGLPTVVPEVLLFYKAKDQRRRDERDFQALLPELSHEQRCWLGEALAHVQPGHAWLGQLSAD